MKYYNFICEQERKKRKEIFYDVTQILGLENLLLKIFFGLLTHDRVNEKKEKFVNVCKSSLCVIHNGVENKILRILRQIYTEII